MVAVERVGRYFDQVNAIRRKKREDQVRIAAERHLRSKIVTKLVVWSLSGTTAAPYYDCSSGGGGLSLRERAESLLSCATAATSTEPLPEANHCRPENNDETAATDTDKSHLSSSWRSRNRRFRRDLNSSGENHQRQSRYPSYPGTTTEEDESSSSSSLGRRSRYFQKRQWMQPANDSGPLTGGAFESNDVADERRDDCDTAAGPFQQRVTASLSWEAAAPIPTEANTIRFSVDYSDADDLKSSLADKVSELVLLELQSRHLMPAPSLQQPGSLSATIRRRIHVEVKVQEQEAAAAVAGRPEVADDRDLGRLIVVPQRPREVRIEVIAPENQQLESPSLAAGAQWRWARWWWWWKALDPLDPEENDHRNEPYFQGFECLGCS